MQRYFIIPVLLICFITTIYAQHRSMKGSEYCSQRKSRDSNKLHSLNRSPNTPKHSFDVLNYDLEMDLYTCYQSPYSKLFHASNLVTFRVDTALNHIVLNADNGSLIIDSVSTPCVSFTHAANLLTIQFGQTYIPGDIVSVKIYYTHKNVNDGAFFASGGFVFTDSQPQGARKWFPCWDQPSDKATMSLKARVPTNVKLGSNGRLQDSIVVGNALIYHWVSAHPVATYITSISSKVNYNLDIVYWPKLSNPTELLPIRFYYNNNENPGPIKNIIGQMTTVFSESFCEHPFEKNGFATLNNQFAWGGMENQTLTNLCPNCWYESLVAHEYAHQWFGDMITCGTWADLFINEAFATWGEAYWYEHKYGYATYHAELVNNASYYLSNNPGWSISNPDWAINPPPNNVLFNYAITYQKASCVLHMLRYVMGDSLFFAGLRSYCADTVNFKYQSAVIPDFRDKMEEVGGIDLDWFFNQWVYQPNHPVYNNTYFIENLGAGLWKVWFNARQVQTNTVFFKMPIEIRIVFQGGQDTLIRVMNDVNHQSYNWTFNKQPVQVQFDPGNHILLKQATLVVGYGEPAAQSPLLFHESMPNPFERFTIIRYGLARPETVRLEIFSASGNLVALLINEPKNEGIHEIAWDAANLTKGVYICRFHIGDAVTTAKLVKQ